MSRGNNTDRLQIEYTMRYQKEEEEYDKEEDAGNCEEMVHVHLLEVAAFSVDIGTLRFVQNAHARAFL